MATESNGLVKPIHEKVMPVMLMTSEDVDRWLAGENVAERSSFRSLRRKMPSESLISRRLLSRRLVTTGRRP